MSGGLLQLKFINTTEIVGLENSFPTIKLLKKDVLEVVSGLRSFLT